MIDDSERVTSINDEHRRARKECKCRECGRVIRVGERYHYEFYIFDGARSSHRTCAHCDVVREWLLRECGGFIYEAVEEDIREHAESHRDFALYRFVAGIRREWTRADGRLYALPILTQQEELQS